MRPHVAPQHPNLSNSHVCSVFAVMYMQQMSSACSGPIVRILDLGNMQEQKSKGFLAPRLILSYLSEM